MAESVIALDFDGCIAYGANAKMRYAKEVFGVELTLGQTADDHSPLGPLRYRQMMNVVGSECIDEYELAPDCREVLVSLTEEGFETVVVTSRSDRQLYAARWFSENHGLPIERFINTNNASKKVVCEELGAIALLDDTLRKLREVEGSDTVLYFLKQQWNSFEHEEASGLESIVPVDNWPGFHQKVREIQLVRGR
jgi:hypothetical protein